MAEESSGPNNELPSTPHGATVAIAVDRRCSPFPAADRDVECGGDLDGREVGSGEDGEEEEEEEEDDDEDLPFPGFVPKAFYCLKQTSFLRLWCLQMITWPYPFCALLPRVPNPCFCSSYKKPRRGLIEGE